MVTLLQNQPNLTGHQLCPNSKYHMQYSQVPPNKVKHIPKWVFTQIKYIVALSEAGLKKSKKLCYLTKVNPSQKGNLAGGFVFANIILNAFISNSLKLDSCHQSYPKLIKNSSWSTSLLFSYYKLMWNYICLNLKQQI